MFGSKTSLDQIKLLDQLLVWAKLGFVSLDDYWHSRLKVRSYILYEQRGGLHITTEQNLLKPAWERPCIVFGSGKIVIIGKVSCNLWGAFRGIQQLTGLSQSRLLFGLLGFFFLLCEKGATDFDSHVVVFLKISF